MSGLAEKRGGMRKGICVERMERWAASARPRAQFIYASGATLPRNDPAVARARQLYNDGIVTLVSRRTSDGHDWIAIKLEVQDRPRKSFDVHDGLDDAMKRVMLMLTRAANFARVAPTRAEIADMCGLPDEKSAEYLERKLVDRGLITVRFGAGDSRRRVTIVASGRTTAAGQA